MTLTSAVAMLRGTFCYSFCEKEEHFFLNILVVNKEKVVVKGVEQDARGSLYLDRLGKLLCKDYFFYLNLHLNSTSDERWQADEWSCDEKVPEPCAGSFDESTLSFYKPRVVPGVTAREVDEKAYDPAPFNKAYRHGQLLLSLYRNDCRGTRRRSQLERTLGEVRHCHLRPLEVLDWDYMSQIWWLSDKEKFIDDYPIQPQNTTTTTGTDGVRKQSNTECDWAGKTKMLAMAVPPHDTPPESGLGNVYLGPNMPNNLTTLERVELATHEGRTGVTVESGAISQFYSEEHAVLFAANRMGCCWRARGMSSTVLKTPKLLRNGPCRHPGPPTAKPSAHDVGTPPLYSFTDRDLRSEKKEQVRAFSLTP